MKNTGKIFIRLLLLLPLGQLTAQSVITTNSWTGTFAKLAGAEQVLQLAPSDMRHPPEYEISLNEMQLVANADYLIFAGYEVMMGRIRESLGSDSNVKMIQINTANDQKGISEAVMKIAEALGTVEKAEKNLKEINTLFESWRSDLNWHKDLILSGEVAVHFHQQGLAKSLGFEDFYVYGPAPPTLGVTKQVLDRKPKLIIDNYHNPVADSFKEMEGSPRIIRWMNFPGAEGTEALWDVLNYNYNQLRIALLDY